MSKHSTLAKDLFEKGYNCSQTVVLAFCDETGVDSETALKISSSFGGAMGRLREVCADFVEYAAEILDEHIQSKKHE